jgi:serine/threonine protein kinase/Flp pilus assembly protein TadD
VIGRVISHYRLVEHLGKGGMGTVYKAVDLRLDRPVAIKLISAGGAVDAAQKTRFEREARAASAVEHVNVGTIYEFDATEEGELFIVSAYVAGQSLRTRLESGPLGLGEAVRVAAQIAQGLAAAHSAGILHRDIKPANVMLTPEGIVKIVDFGLAKLPQDAEASTPGTAAGTIAYMSPEQVRGDALDHRTDIWSWGVTMYEALTGQRPFRGDSHLSLSSAILNQEPPPLGEHRPETPPELEGTVMRALRKRPAERQQSAEEVARELEQIAPLSGSGIARREGVVSGASIAVLPFANLSSEADSEYFSEGLTEELIHALSRLPNLHVVSRTSAFEFKAKPQDVRRIGEKLRVSTVLEGSVRKSGQKLRVSVQLVSAADGYCLWSQRFDEEMKDVFEIQDEIARTIADTLKVELGRDGADALARRRTTNLEAYDLYLRGRFHWNKRGGEGFAKALECFEAALIEDPNYAAAYSGIADYHIAVASWGLEPPGVAWKKAKAAASRALEIDETLSEAHASMGTIRMWYEWNWKEAEREFQRAIELNPGHPNGHVQYNLLLVQTGRFEEAEREIRAALAADPLSVSMHAYYAGVFHYRRDYDRSLVECQKALELDPDDIELHVVRGLNYEQKGMFEQAIAELERARELSGNNPLILGPLGSCYGGSGQKARAMQLIAELDRVAQQTYVPPITWAMIYLGMKEKDQAFDWLEKAAEARDVLLCYLGAGPIYDSIRNDPRYGELLKRLGLAVNTQWETLTT